MSWSQRERPTELAETRSGYMYGKERQLLGESTSRISVSSLPAQAPAPHRRRVVDDDDDDDDGRSCCGLRRVGGRIWFGIAAVIVIGVVVGVAVGVTQAKKNRYPDYTKLNYSLVDTYSGTGFFDKFNYFEGWDPTHGFVHYVPRERATQLNLTTANSTNAVVKVDTSVGPNSEPNASTGRFSVRLESKQQYNNGLFIFDVLHTPYGCGTWPALWLTDPANWPANGEIDVMESVNQGTSGNNMTLHALTSQSSCDMGGVKRLMTGSELQGDCSNSTNDNAGCGVSVPGTATAFGESFNKLGGGVMAVEWRSEGIRMWQFARSGVPADITGGKPDPSVWGTATADFPNTDCDITGHFKNQSIIVNIDLCGTLTEAQYPGSGCPSNCSDYVANNPSAFQTAFWEFGAFNVYSAS